MCTGNHPFIGHAGVLKMTMMYDQAGLLTENVIYAHHKDDANFTASQGTSLGSAVEAAWAANLAPHTANNCTLSNIRVTDMSSASGFSILETFGDVGALTTEPLPNGVTKALKLTTTKRGRSFRGRVFVTGVVDNRLTPDELTHSYADQLLTGWRAILTAINAVTNVEMVVFSQCQNNAWLSTAQVTPVSSIDSVSYLLDYQRRRAAGHNRHR